MLNVSERFTPLTPEQLNEYEQNGYVIIRHGCSHDLINAFNSHIYSLRLTDQDVSEEKRFSTRVFNPHNHDGFSLQMMKLPIVREAIEQILGKEAVGIQSMYFFKEPGAKGQAAHQDYEYIKNEPNTMIAVWIAMEKTDEQNGCLWVIPGSHKLGLLKHGQIKDLTEYEDFTTETQGVDLKSQVPVVLDKGDILIFHNLLVHSSTRNRTIDRWRRSYVCHYIWRDSIVQRKDLQRKVPLV